MAKITRDEIADAERAARTRGIDARVAVAERAIAIALHRPWDGALTKVSSWKIWDRLGIAVVEVHAVPTALGTDSLTIPQSAKDASVHVLVSDRDLPALHLLGWMLARDARAKESYARSVDGKDVLVVPASDLRPAIELRKERRSHGRLSASDPADDFGGSGRYPGMLDHDDGQIPSSVSTLYPARHALPCRRCQTVVAVGALAAWSPRTGWIHGEPAECKARAR